MNRDNERLRQFIENLADLMEERGFPHMAGRIIGAFLICMPPHLAQEELAELLQVSKGSISMSIQLLMRMNVVERISIPGQRRHFYRLRENLWKGFHAEQIKHLCREREAILDGLAILEGEPVDMKQRLLEMLAAADFVLEEWPRLLSRWEAQQDELIDKRLTEMAQDAKEK